MSREMITKLNDNISRINKIWGELADISGGIAKWQEGPNKDAALQGVVNLQDQLIAYSQEIMPKLKKLGVPVGE